MLAYGRYFIQAIPLSSFICVLFIFFCSDSLCGKIHCMSYSNLPSQYYHQMQNGVSCVSTTFDLGSDVPDPALVQKGTACDQGKVREFFAAFQPLLSDRVGNKMEIPWGLILPTQVVDWDNRWGRKTTWLYSTPPTPTLWIRKERRDETRRGSVEERSDLESTFLFQSKELENKG